MKSEDSNGSRRGGRNSEKKMKGKKYWVGECTTVRKSCGRAIVFRKKGEEELGTDSRLG